MAREYRVGLIGCGRMGATIDDEVRDHPHSDLWIPFSHAAGYVAVERTSLVAVADAIPEKAEAIRQRYGAQRAYTDYREMIERERLDIVSVATRAGDTPRDRRLRRRARCQGDLLRKAALLLDGRGRRHRGCL